MTIFYIFLWGLSGIFGMEMINHTVNVNYYTRLREFKRPPIFWYVIVVIPLGVLGGPIFLFTGFCIHLTELNNKDCSYWGTFFQSWNAPFDRFI